jgi:hypothetical protein
VGSWNSIDSERAPSAGLGMAALFVVIGLLLMGIGWLAITTFLSIVTDLSHLA